MVSPPQSTAATNGRPSAKAMAKPAAAGPRAVASIRSDELMLLADFQAMFAIGEEAWRSMKAAGFRAYFFGGSRLGFG